EARDRKGNARTMATFVKFFKGKSKKSKEHNDKENQEHLQRVNFERASTRSEIGVSDAERDRQAMRALANPYSVWTEPKKTRGPSSCPGVTLDSSSYFNERRSTRPPKQERAGSVYGGMGGMNGLRQYRIDEPAGNGHHQQHRSSRRYGDLSMIEERSERGDRSMRHQQQQEDWSRASQRRSHHNHHRHNQSYADYTSGDSEEEGGYERMLKDKIYRLKDDKKELRSAVEKYKYELEYVEYELKKQVEQNNQLASNLKQSQKKVEQLTLQLKMERENNDLLEARLSAMSASSCTSNGAMERLVSSSETSLEMSREEEEEREEMRERQREEEDEVRNFRGSDSLAVSSAATNQAASAVNIDAAQLVNRLMHGNRITDEDEMEMSRKGDTASPLEFELRRSASDMGPSVHHRQFIDGAPEEMAALEGGSWRRREKRRSFVKRSLLPSQESESSDGERILLTEKQLRKKGGVVKYDPNRRVHVKEKHYKRFGKPERSALEKYSFLEHEITDVSGMLSSPNEGNY
ncbi:hypothetical protein PFISCL1PPCAC_17811, partial [Pristionchus fissidentatus]